MGLGNLELHENLIFVHDLPRLYKDPADPSSPFTLELVLHLHGLDDDEPLAGYNLIPFLGLNFDHQTGHWGSEGLWPHAPFPDSHHFPNCPGSFLDYLSPKLTAGQMKCPLFGAIPAGENPVRPLPQQERMHPGSIHLHQVGMDFLSIHPNSPGPEFHL